MFETSGLTLSLSPKWPGRLALPLVVRRNGGVRVVCPRLLSPAAPGSFVSRNSGLFRPSWKKFQRKSWKPDGLGATGLVHGIYSTAKWVVKTIFGHESRQNPLVADLAAILFMHTCRFRSWLSGTRPEHKRETCDELLSFLGR